MLEWRVKEGLCSQNRGYRGSAKVPSKFMIVGYLKDPLELLSDSHAFIVQTPHRQKYSELVLVIS